MADLSKQLELQRQINKALADRQSLLEKNASSLNKQARLAKELCKALECKELDGLESRLNGINNSLSQTAEKASTAGRSMGDLNKSAKDSADSFEAMNKKALMAAGAVGFIKGLRKSFGALKNVMSGAVRLVGSFAKSLFNVGKAILSIPFKIFSGLVEMSNQMGSPAFLQALEEVRKTLGDIGSGPGKAAAGSVREMRKEMRGMYGEAGAGGITFGRMFGYGPEGMAAGLKFNMELVEALGGTYATLAGQLKGNYSSLAKYRRSLGITAEAQALMINLAYKQGDGVMSMQERFAEVAVTMGRGTEFSAKQIGTTMGKMFEDVKNFGGFTEQELGNMSVATKRLGVDMKTLQGVIGAFDDFDTAAQNVASLNRNFGMHIDMLALHRKEDPVERIMMLQKAFKATGKSVETMGRRRVAELAKRSGMTEKEARILYARNNLEGDYNKIKDLSNKNKKKELSTAQVLLKLTKQIDKVFGSGSKKYKGFFDAMGQGFVKGARRTQEFRGVMRNLRRSLHMTDRAGQQLGRNFIKSFPGVKQLLAALQDFFNPAKLGPALREINQHFDVFFKMLSGGRNTRKAIDQLGEGVMGTLKKYFGGKGQAVEMFKQSLDTIVTLYGNIKLILLERSVKMASSTIHAFTDGLQSMMSGDSKVGDQFGAAGDAMGQRFGKEFVNLFNTIKFDLIPAVKRAAPVIGKAVMLLFKKMKGWMWKHKRIIFEGIKDTMLFVFKMKWEFMKFMAGAMFSKEGFTIGLMLMVPAIGGGIVSMLKVVLARKILPWLAMNFAPKIAMAMVNQGLVSAAVSKSMTTAMVAKGTATVATNVAAGTSSLVPAAAAATTGGAGAVAWAKRIFSKGGGFLKTFTKVGTKFLRVAGPIGAVIGAGLAGFNFGTAIRNTKGGWRRKMKAGFKAALGSVTFGITDKLFGPMFEEPIRDTMHQLGKSSDKLTSRMGKNAAAAHDMSRAYRDHAKAIKHADSAANNAMKNQMKTSDHALNVVLNNARRMADKEAVFADKQIANLTTRGATVASLRSGFRQDSETIYRGKNSTEIGPTSSVSLSGNDANQAASRMYKKLRKSGKSPELAAAINKALSESGVIDLSDPGIRAQWKEQLDKAAGSLDTEMLKARGRVGQVGRKFMVKQLGGIDQASEMVVFWDKQIASLKSKGGEAAEAQAAALEKQKAALQFGMNALRRDAFKKSERGNIFEKMAEAEHKALFSQTLVKLGGKASWEKMSAKEKEAIVKDITNRSRQSVKLAIDRNMFKNLSTTAQEMANAEIAIVKASTGKSTSNAAQMEKMEQLEAAAETVRRIEALSGIPAKLKVLEKKLKGISKKKLESQAKLLVESAKIISDAMNSAVKAHGMGAGATATVISGMIMGQMANVQEIRQFISAVIDKPIPGESKQKQRIDLLKYGIEQSTAMLKGVGADQSTLAALVKANSVLQQLNASMSFAPVIFGQIPKDIRAQVNRADIAMKGVRKMIDQLSDQSLAGKKIKGVVDLAKAVNQGGALTVVHQQGKIEATFVVYVNAQQMGNAIVAAPLDGGSTYIQTGPKQAGG